jgi:fumarate hydratase class II|tara:strand:- start:601 stop:1989 length:1389 start_codon:yes stop_codon:yes gene_type:complete
MSERYRIEKDSLGEVQVPLDALYGAQTQRALENFPISGYRFSRRFIQALGLIKQYAATVNEELGYIDATLASAIVKAASEVAAGEWDEAFVLDIYQTGSGTSTNMNANEVIARRANQILESDSVHPNDHVNFGQSSNDVIPSAIHIASRISLELDLIPALNRLKDALSQKAEEFDDVVKSGRTHLMDATPVRLGQQFGGYAHQIDKGIQRVKLGSNELVELALGGTAVGTGINTHPDFAKRTISRISEALSLEFCEAENHFEAQAAKDGIVQLSGCLNTLATSYFKIADDLRWLASGPTSGLSEIQLPAVQPGSSIMPGKVNPVMSEAMMMVAARVMGNHTTATIAGQRGNFELNVTMPLLAYTTLESIRLLANMARVFADRCVQGITVNEQRTKELLEKNPSIATALNTFIGYDKASEVAKEAAREGVSVREIVHRHNLIDPDKIDDALDVRKMTEPGLPE